MSPPPSAPYRAVFFDLGGTLFSYREVGRWTIGALQGMAEQLGVDAPLGEIGLAYRAASNEANDRYVTQPFYLHRDLFRDTFAGFAERLGKTPTPEFIDWSETALRDALVENMVLRGDCLETLAKLRDEGLYLSIVSNIDDDHLMPMVDRSGLADVLHHWTSSEEARSCKPDPGFFHLALEKANVSPEQVLFVGDSPEHDVLGAKGVGMSAALIVEEGVNPPFQSDRETVDPDHEIRTLAELLPIVTGR
jgi:putative hydrolase of the HAD superfamily